MGKLIDGFLAGLLIAIGGGVYLMCENKVVGAVLFGVALLCICYRGYNLYTGKICYIPEKHDKEAVTELFLGLLGNLIGTVMFGLMLAYAVPQMHTAAITACNAKLDQTVLQTFVRALMCGVLIYMAVDIFKKSKTPLGILFCIPVFILSGYEHSIADMFYFSAAKEFSVQAILFILMVIVGNAFGGMLIPVFKQAGEKMKKRPEGNNVIEENNVIEGNNTTEKNNVIEENPGDKKNAE